MTETNTEEILGRPINGDIPRDTTGWGKQSDPRDLIAAIDKVLAFDDVEGVRWEQFTPGFNDGEPCVFGTHEVTVKFKGLDEHGDAENGYLSLWDGKWHDDRGYDGTREDILLGGVDRTAVFNALSELDAELGEDHYSFLLETFGDPSEITATREGFDVEYYDCGY